VIAVVLVVDDEPALRSALAQLLAEEGWQVLTAPNGEAALATQLATPADLIISDVMMPVVDGHQLVRALRARGDETPVILMSALARGSDHAIPPGFAGVIPKPFDPLTLPQQIRAILGMGSS